MERNHHRRPPDVEEALSSMLWTPYERTPSDSSSDEDEKLNAKLKKSKSSDFDFNFPTQYVPSSRKIQRYDNFRFSYPYYGPIPTVQKCITELPSYESLYHNMTPVFSNISALNGRLVHSFTDNFITQSQTRPSSVPEAATTILHITSSLSGFSSNFCDEDERIAPQLGLGPVNPALFMHKSFGAEELTKLPWDPSTSPATSAAAMLTPSELVDPQANYVHCRQMMMAARNLGTSTGNPGDLLPGSSGSVDRQQQHHLKKLFCPQQWTDLQQNQSTDQATTIASDRTIDLFNDPRVTKLRTLRPASADALAPFSAPSVSQHHHSQSLENYERATWLSTTSCREVQADVEFGTRFSSARNVEVGASTVDSHSNVASDFIHEEEDDEEEDEDDESISSESAHIGVGGGAGNYSVNALVGNSALAMRLSVPGASASVAPAKDSILNGIGGGNSTTSVFLPSNDNGLSIPSHCAVLTGSGKEVAITMANFANHRNVIADGTLIMGAIVPSQPSLTIQVNQNHESVAIENPLPSANNNGNYNSSSNNNNNSKWHDQPRNVVNQSTSTTTTTTTKAAGISVVNCFSSSVPPFTPPLHANSVNNKNNNNNNREVCVVPNTVTTTTDNIQNLANSINNNNCNVNNNNNNNSGSNGNNISCHSVSEDLVRNPIGLHQSTGINNNFSRRALERTFTSTESQTENVHLDQNDIQLSSPDSGGVLLQQQQHQQQSPGQTEALITREQRRRERRERRQARGRHPHILAPPPPPIMRPMLPDILHSHYPPPYTALTLSNPPPPPSSMITPVISTVPIATAVSDGRFTFPLPVIRRSPSERSGKGCCGQWFAGPPLRALIAVVALGGVACALGGAALGATGLAGPPSSHLTAALLMIGVGVILVTVSGAAWRMTAPGGPPCLGLGSTVDLGRCGRRPCSSSRGAPHGLLYPEFQHRPPPPSYQASMQEYRLRLLLLDRDRQSGVVRGSSPPPTYRSHAGSLLSLLNFRTPLSTATRHGGGASSNFGGGGGTNSIGGPGSEYSLPPSYRSRHTTLTHTNGNFSHTTSGSNNNNNVTSGIVHGVDGNNTLDSMGNLNNNNNNPVPDASYQSRPTIVTTAETTVVGTKSLTLLSSSITDSSASTADSNGQLRRIGAALNNNNPEIQSQNHSEKLNPRVLNRNFSNNNNINNNYNNNIINNNNNNNASNTSNNSCTNSVSSPSSTKPIIATTNNEQSFNLKNSSINTNSNINSVANGNRKELVTIVTISASQGPPNTVTATSNTGDSQSQSEMEILAHL